MAEPEKTHLFDDPRNVRRAIHVLYALCAVTVVLDFVVHRHVDHPWEAMWAFYCIYGFVACVLLVLVARELRRFLMRGEDYYDGSDRPSPVVGSADDTDDHGAG